MDGYARNYLKGKTKIKSQKVQLAEGVVAHLGNLEQDKILVKRQGVEDLIYIVGDYFIVGPKTTKNTMGIAQTDNAIITFFSFLIIFQLLG